MCPLCRVRLHDEAIDSDGVLHQQLVGRQSRGGGSLAPPLERVLVSQAPPVQPVFLILESSDFFQQHNYPVLNILNIILTIKNSNYLV